MVDGEIGGDVTFFGGRSCIFGAVDDGVDDLALGEEGWGDVGALEGDDGLVDFGGGGGEFEVGEWDAVFVLKLYESYI